MFKEPVLVVKSRRGSLQQQQQQQQLSGSLVSAVLDSASSASPRIYPLDPACSIELVETNNNNINSLQHLQSNHHLNHHNTTLLDSSSNGPRNNTKYRKGKDTHSNTNRIHLHRPSLINELSLVPATAPPYPHVLQAPAGTLGINHRDSGVTSATTSTASTSTSPSPTVPHHTSEQAAKEAQIVPESNGIGQRLFNGFYDDFLDGLPFRRQPANTYCDPPARRFSLMGRAGTARNSEFKRNPIAQHRQR